LSHSREKGSQECTTQEERARTTVSGRQ